MANSEQLESAEVSHQIYLQRLASGTASKLNPVLEDFGKWVRRRILSEGETIETKKALNALLKDVNERMSGDLNGWVDLLQSDLDNLAGYEPQFQAKLIDSAITNEDFSANIPATSQVISAASNNPLVLGANNSAVSYQGYIDSYTKQQVSQAASIISGGFSQGQTTAAISSNLLNNGLVKSSREGFTLAKTTTNHMAAIAKDKTFRENSDVVIGYVIVATLDSKTSDICKFHDGQEVKWSDGYQPMPPFHYNCRTTTSPLINGKYSFDDSSATRASVGDSGAKQVSAKDTYYSWLKKQDAELQNEALGQERAAIFRNAGLSASEFRNESNTRMGKPLTIDEMAKKDDRIAEYLKK